MRPSLSSGAEFCVIASKRLRTNERCGKLYSAFVRWKRHAHDSPSDAGVSAQATYDFRCPVHGFVTLSAWERDVIDHPVFQRLRRVRQLGWTDTVYPGATHTRFEHSLGVMHTASRMFDEVWRRNSRALGDLHFSEASRARDKIVLRLAALLHDVGHSPFSHAGEDIMPKGPTGKRYKHEQYSVELVRELMKDVIDDHPHNKKAFGIGAGDVADFIEGKSTIGQALLFWRQLMTSQLDADRADYLLRDSHHIGVQYGHYDLNRLVISLSVAADEAGNAILAIDEGGWHTAEALLLARYMMFSQVYFHKTRIVYDHHIGKAMQSILADEQSTSGLAEPSAYPPPVGRANLEAYVAWNDWRALGIIQAGGGGEHGEILRARKHFREVYHTAEIAKRADLTRAEKIAKRLGPLLKWVADPEHSWYKLAGEIFVAQGPDDSVNRKLIPLSVYSNIVAALKPNTNMRRLYVAHTDVETARKTIEKIAA